MPTTTANMLTEGQVVQLDLGGKTTALPCRVLGFGGSTVMLAPVVPATAPTADAIEAGREAYVILDDDKQVHALRARVRPGSEPGEIVVTVTDAFRLGQRRRYSRAPLSLPATVGTLAAGETWETVTRDISAGGVRMARTGAPGEQADALSVVLHRRRRACGSRRAPSRAPLPARPLAALHRDRRGATSRCSHRSPSPTTASLASP